MKNLSAVGFIKNMTFAMAIIAAVSSYAHAQEYSPLTKGVDTGNSPGVKVKLLSSVGGVKNYVLVYKKGDEILSGLVEFAEKYRVKSAHYTGFGDASSARLGWFDAERKMFKVTSIGEPSEVTGITGDISLYNGKRLAHAHFSLATSDGICHGGHLLQLIVGPTFEIMVTVEPTPLYKKANPEFGALVVDPTLDR